MTTPAPNDFPRELLAAYVDGELDADARLRVERWLADHPSATICRLLLARPPTPFLGRANCPSPPRKMRLFRAWKCNYGADAAALGARSMGLGGFTAGCAAP